MTSFLKTNILAIVNVSELWPAPLTFIYVHCATRFSWGLLPCYPGPLKCFCAPSHQILAKSAPQKARNRDKADFATKVRESSMNNWGTFDSKSLFKGGTFDSLSLVLTFSGGTFEDFTTTKSPYLRRLPDSGQKRVWHQSYVPPHTAVCPHPWVPWV